LFDNLVIMISIFILGYIVKKLNLFPENYSKAFIDFIMKVGFPALVIYNVYYLHIDFRFIYVILFGIFGILLGIFTGYLISKFLKLDKKQSITVIMMVSFSNTGFLGYPFIHALYGEEGLRYAIIFDNLAMFVPISFLAPVILSFSKEDKKLEFLNILKSVFLSIPFLALIVGFLLKPFYLPPLFLKMLHTLGDTVIPLIMFSLGMILKFSHLKENIKLISFILFIRNIFIPSLLLIILILVNVDLTLEWKVGLLEMAMPPMVLASIYVIEANLDKDTAVSSVASGIILSFITIPIFYLILERIL